MVAQGDMAGFRASLNASQNEDPYYSGYFFEARNQTRPQGNHTGNPLYDVGRAQNQPLPHYPAMLNPYAIYQNPLPGTNNRLQFEPDKNSASPSPTSQTSNRSDDRNKHSSWSLTESNYILP